jgi:FixJ family two-component response regulator
VADDHAGPRAELREVSRRRSRAQTKRDPDGTEAGRIAYDIGISEIAVKVYRSQVIRKMKVSSLPDLARMADKLNFTADGSQVC